MGTRGFFKHELVRYFCVGGGAVFIDFITYMAMIGPLNLNQSLSKGISYVLGALFAFAINKLWTFDSNRKTHEAFLRFAVLYATTFTLNVCINAFTLWLGFIAVIGFVLATATSILLNYIGQKFWVFKGE